MTAERVVVDASVLAKIYLKDESFADLAQQAIDAYAGGTVDFIAPQIILYEIPSAIQGAVRRRRLDARSAEEAIGRFLALELAVVGTPDTLGDIDRGGIPVANNVGCRIYDALYLAVADALGLPFLTADRRLYDAALNHVDRVIWIEDVVAFLESHES